MKAHEWSMLKASSRANKVHQPTKFISSDSDLCESSCYPPLDLSLSQGQAVTSAECGVCVSPGWQ